MELKLIYHPTTVPHAAVVVFVGFVCGWLLYTPQTVLSSTYTDYTYIVSNFLHIPPQPQILRHLPGIISRRVVVVGAPIAALCDDVHDALLPVDSADKTIWRRPRVSCCDVLRGPRELGQILIKFSQRIVCTVCERMFVVGVVACRCDNTLFLWPPRCGICRNAHTAYCLRSFHVRPLRVGECQVVALPGNLSKGARIFVECRSKVINHLLRQESPIVLLSDYLIRYLANEYIMESRNTTANTNAWLTSNIGLDIYFIHDIRVWFLLIFIK